MLLRIAERVPAGSRVLDVGCGSGIISVAAASAGAVVTAVDVNDRAVESTRRATAGLNVHVAKSGLLQNVRGGFDYIFFNAPYLPASADGADDAAWTGGKSGNELIFSFLSQVRGHLTEKGRAFFTCSSLAGFGALEKKLGELGFRFRVALEEHAGLMETLRVYQVW